MLLRLFTLILFASFFAGSPVHANEFKVLKVQGNRAVVETEEPLEKNEGYRVIEIATDSEYALRRLLVGISGEFSSLFNTSSGNTNTYSASPKFGWNQGWSDFGPQISISSTDKNGVVTLTYSVGAFYDLNFLENQPLQSFVPGVCLRLLPGGKNVTNTGTSTYFNLTGEIGLKADWFFAESSTAFRVDLAFHYETDTDISSNKSDQTIGPRLLLGIESYF